MVSRSDIRLLINYSQYTLRTCVWIQAAILIVWSFFGLVPDVGNILNAESGFHSVTHWGFWMAIEIFTLMVGGTALAGTPNGAVLTLYVVTLVLAISANIVHGTGVIFELARGTSPVSIQYPLVLFTLLCLYALLALLEGYCIYLTVQYKNFLTLKDRFRIHTSL
jgi:hypothetical protein